MPKHSKTKYLKGVCQHCDGHLEFLAEHIGMMVPCPHCGKETELELLPPPEEPTVPRRALVWTGIAILILVVGLGAALIALKRAQNWAQSQRLPASVPAAVEAPPVEQKEAPTSSGTNSLAQQGYDVSAVAVEKTPGTSLIYAVGTIKNTTDHQRFGVKVELELLDAAGGKLGGASDYRQVLEPGAQWQFKALVVDAKTASAKISSIHEDK
jgi:hypothetical protein